MRTHLATIYRNPEVSSTVELASRLNGATVAPLIQTELNSVISESALNLEEALSREKALSEVLRITSASHGDLDRVIPSIRGYALALCDAELGILFEYNQKKPFLTNFA